MHSLRMPYAVLWKGPYIEHWKIKAAALPLTQRLGYKGEGVECGLRRSLGHSLVFVGG